MKKYDKRGFHQWQKKAWYDRTTCCDWVDAVFRPARLALGFKDKKSMLFMDNLDGQKCAEFVRRVERAKATPHYTPANMTDDLQLVDKGLGKMLKNQMGIILEEKTRHLSPKDNQAMTLEERRILITTCACDAWEYVCKTYDFQGNFDKIGGTINRDGPHPEMSNISLQCFKGQTNADGSPYTFSYDVVGAVAEAVPASFTAEDKDIMDLFDDVGDDGVRAGMKEDEVEELETEGDMESGSSSDDDDRNVAGPEYSGEDEQPASFHDCPHAASFCEKDVDDSIRDRHALAVPDTLVAHVFDEVGWAVGKVKKVGAYRSHGHVAWVKYPDQKVLYSHRLKHEDYGTTWLIVTPR